CGAAPVPPCWHSELRLGERTSAGLLDYPSLHAFHRERTKYRLPGDHSGLRLPLAEPSRGIEPRLHPYHGCVLPLSLQGRVQLSSASCQRRPVRYSFTGGRPINRKPQQGNLLGSPLFVGVEHHIWYHPLRSTQKMCPD